MADDTMMRDKERVREHLYADPGKLGARIDLHDRYGTNPVRFPEWELDLVDLRAVRRALDVGCGTGNFLLPLARRLAARGGTVVGLDLAAGVLATARARVEAAGLPVTCQIGDIEALPFADGTFDLALANFMLYHVPNLDRGIAEMRRVLRSGGVLLAATNGTANMHELFALEKAACAEAGVPANVVAGLFAPDRHDTRMSFTLENGAEWLERHFACVRLERYPDELRVTEIEPLAAYCASMWTIDEAIEATTAEPVERAVLRERIVERFRALAAERMASAGYVRVTKDAGAFVAI